MSSCQDYFMSQHNDIRYIVAVLHHMQELISEGVCHNSLPHLLPAVYKAPYLLAFCDSALEVYEVTTGKWIQTLPFRKVMICSVMNVMICSVVNYI